MRYSRTIFLGVALLFVVSLYAHPASEIIVSYDKDSMILAVEFTHSVSDPAKHYIDKVDVVLGKKDLVIQELMSQDTAEGGKVLYKIRDLKPGDTVKVKVNCNRFGGKSTEYTIE